MKLEIVFKDGRKETFDGVVSFNVTEEQITKKKEEWEIHSSRIRICSVFEWRQESNLRVPDSESTPRAWFTDIPK